MTSPSHWTEADRRRVLAHLAETANVEATLAAFPGLTLSDLRAMLPGDTPPRAGRGVGSSPEVTAGTTVVAHVDGASRGNPGHAAIGVVLEDAMGHILRRISRYIGRTTNNVAEYTALIEAL